MSRGASDAKVSSTASGGSLSSEARLEALSPAVCMAGTAKSECTGRSGSLGRALLGNVGQVGQCWAVALLIPMPTSDQP